MAKIRVLAPEYYKDFTCIGTDCEDNCCKSWGIPIDKATYQKYRKLKKGQFNPLEGKSIVVNKENRTTSHYAKIEFREDGYCPFLTEDRLCGVYQKLGYDYMSDICKSYPRAVRYIDNQMEISLIMSCPEAVRKALLSTDIMAFEYLDIEFQDYMKKRNASIYTEGEELICEEHRYFWDIRMAAIDILQNRRFTIVERLMLLGMMYKKIQACIDTKDYENIPVQIDEFMRIVEVVNPRELFSDMEGNRAIQLFALKTMVDEKILESLNGTKAMFDFMVKPRTALFSKNKDGEVDRFALDNYVGYLQCGINPALQEYSHIIENYLVNLYFNTCMPFSYKFRTMWESLLYLCSMYSMIKIALIGVFFEKREKITQEDMVDGIYHISKEFEHNIYYSKVTNIIATELELNTLGGLYVLIHD